MLIRKGNRLGSVIICYLIMYSLTKLITASINNFIEKIIGINIKIKFNKKSTFIYIYI